MMRERTQPQRLKTNDLVVQVLTMSMCLSHSMILEMDFVSMTKQRDVPYLPSKEWQTRFDIVSGSLFKRIGREGTIRHWDDRADQTSIHTNAAVDLFNRYMSK